MSIFTAIFGDRYAQRVGQTLLRCFERGDFPQELLQNLELNLLYREFIFKKAQRAGQPDGEEMLDYLDALLAARRGESADKSQTPDP